MQAKEDTAYDELVRIYHASIYHLAVRMLDDPGEAADITQDTLKLNIALEQNPARVGREQLERILELLGVN